MLDLNKLAIKCAEIDCGMDVYYWPNSDGASITIHSAAPAEICYQKRVYDINDFIESWMNNLNDMKKLPMAEVIALNKKRWFL